MPLFLMGCLPVDFLEVKRPLRTKSVKRPIKVGKRPINEGKRPIKAKVLVGVSVGCLMGCFRAPPPWRKTAPLKRPIKRSMINVCCQLEDFQPSQTYQSNIKEVMQQHTTSRRVPAACWECCLESSNWRQIWRVAGRESGSPELLGSPRTSPEVPRTSPEVFRRLPRKFSHCGT